MNRDCGANVRESCDGRGRNCCHGALWGSGEGRFMCVSEQSAEFCEAVRFRARILVEGMLVRFCKAMKRRLLREQTRHLSRHPIG